MKKIYILLSFVFLFLCGLAFNVKAETNNNELTAEFIKGAKAGILIEETSGEILYEKEKDLKLSPASMTKIMTLLLIYEAIDNKIITKDTILTISSHASSMGGSQVYLEENEKISVDEALKCVCIVSANDAAVCFAEAIWGSEDQFVVKMNEKAKSLGCKNTNFTDCTGLNEANHYTSAYDMALIARELIVKHHDVLNYTNIREDYIRKDTSSPFWLVNTNKLVGRVEGLNGLKTGYTSFSGYCITLHMRQNNMGLISVVFAYDLATRRNSESLELLRYGFNSYEVELVMPKNTILESFSNINYHNKISILLKEDIYVLKKKNTKLDTSYTYNYEVADEKLNGKLLLNANNKSYEIELITNDSLKRRNVFEIIMQLFGNIFG